MCFDNLKVSTAYCYEWTRSCRVVKESDWIKCQSRNSPGFIASIFQHSGISRAVDEVVLNKVLRKIKPNFSLYFYDTFFQAFLCFFLIYLITILFFVMLYCGEGKHTVINRKGKNARIHCFPYRILVILLLLTESEGVILSFPLL